MKSFFFVPAIVILFIMQPSGLHAEKGALGFEIAAGALEYVLNPPAVYDPQERKRENSFYSGIGIRYSLTHNFSLGITGSAGPGKWISLEEVSILDKTDGSLLYGRLVYNVRTSSMTIVSRHYLAGYNWRSYLEPRIGIVRRTYRDLDHRFISSGSVASYGLDMDNINLDLKIAGLGMGLEHVWNRISIGMRMGGAVVSGREKGWKISVSFYTTGYYYP